MTSRERITAALYPQPTDRTPRHEHFRSETRDASIAQDLPPDTGSAGLKSAFGRQVAFMGNVDVMVLRTNNRDLVRREVLGKLEAGTAGGGYVFHSDHSVPPEVSLETYRYCQTLIDQFDRNASGG